MLQIQIIDVCCVHHLAGLVKFMSLLSEIHKHCIFTFQVNVCLECMSTNMKTLKRRFIRCSAQATITHLKKFIAKKVLNGTEKYRDVSLAFACYSWCVCVCVYIQGVPGGKDLTSGECSLGQTITI